MQMDLEELLTSSQGDSPASRGQSQGLKQGQKMTVTSGQKWLPLLKAYNLRTVTFVVPAAACGAPHKRDRCWIVARNVGNTQHDGPSAAEVRRGSDEASDNLTQGQKPSSQSQGASEPTHSVTVAHTRHGSGWDIGSAETGQDTQAERTPHHGQTARPSGEPSPVADTDSQRGCGRVARWQDAEDAGQPPRGEVSGRRHSLMRLDRMADGLSAWMDEPCPRVATGQKQRAARLKGLGNAVIPQIPEMIGYAILEACHD